MDKRKYIVLSAGILAIVIAALLIYAYLSIPARLNIRIGEIPNAPAIAPSTAQGSFALLSITLSDSPMLYNISGIFVTVASISLHNKANGIWYFKKLYNQTYNLVELDNVSKAMSNMSVPLGSYDGVILNITNVTAEVNGQNQSVILPSTKVDLPVNFNTSNATTNWANIDFNLLKSVHVAGNGKIVMLPVINFRYVNGAQLEINKTGLVEVKADGSTQFVQAYGMNYNGSMNANFAIPQNTSIFPRNGTEIVVNGGIVIPIVMRGAGGVILVPNASQAIAVGPDVIHKIINSAIIGNNAIPINQNCLIEQDEIYCQTSNVINSSTISNYLIGIKTGVTQIYDYLQVNKTSAYPSMELPRPTTPTSTANTNTNHSQP